MPALYRRDRSLFGALCEIDPEPRNVKDEHVLDMFRLFARMIGDSLETDEKLRKSEFSVQQERHLAEIQQAFIAILAHDLRNPISALGAGLRILGRSDLDDPAIKLVTLMQVSLGWDHQPDRGSS